MDATELEALYDAEFDAMLETATTGGDDIADELY